MARLLVSALLGALLAGLVSLLLSQAGRRAYPVHEHGAVLITGASTGIGQHAAVTIAMTRSNIIVYAGVRKERDAQAIRELNLPNLRPLFIDVAKDDSVVEAVGHLKAELSEAGVPLIGLVNNAGVSNNAPVEYLPLEKMRNVFQVNVFGLVHLTQLLTRALRESNGRVVMVSSVLGRLTMPTRACYAASKHAVEAITDVLRVELSHWNVSVSAVEPAYVKSEIFGKIQRDTEEIIEGEGREVYGSLFYRPDQAAKRAKQIAKASPPSVTTDAIDHALFSPYPSTRYVVANFDGLPAAVLVWLAWVLPDRIQDLIKLNL